MKQYLNLVGDILMDGSLTPQRAMVKGKPVNMLVLPGLTFKHDLRNGFPLLTTKFVPLNLVAAELEFFIAGEHRKEELHRRNCHIWDEWQKPGQDDPNELGRIYGVQWRSWLKYVVNRSGFVEEEPIDQFKNLVDMLKSNPYDRRTLVTAWNPAEIDQMALPACHVMFQTVTTLSPYNNHVLNLCMTQRSCDMMLGVPFNIASYALLLHLLAKETRMQAGELTCFFVNAHIYENHVEAARLQLLRRPHLLPEIEVLSREGEEFDIFKWRYTDVKLSGYKHHPAIKMEVAV
jgi:thymidylate synthase